MQYQIEKCGKEEGIRVWDAIIKKKTETQKRRREAGVRYNNGRTLHEYQIKHGVGKGYSLWKKRNDKQAFRWSKEHYIQKFGKELGELEYEKLVTRLVKQVRKNSSFSKISQTLFWPVYNQLTDQQKLQCKFGELNEEEILYINTDSVKIIKPDFKCGECIIEYDGTYWHSQSGSVESDILRDRLLESKGYRILRIKEADYILNKQETINKCVKFLNETT